MKLKVTRVDVWAATIEDRPGGLATKLKTLAKAKANLEFIVARRAPDRPGKGVVFVTPITGKNQVAAARRAGFKRTDGLHSVRIEGADKPGLGAKIADALAVAGINLRGVSGAALGKRFIAHLALDTSAAATKAIGVLKKM